MSAGHNDEERLARWHLGKEEQDRLIERFKDRDDPLAVLIVCDMLLTGFDVPVEQVMYLDAPLKEHTLLQAIARVNRPHGDEKTYGLVVDYWGVSADLQDALAVFSTTDVQGALTPNVDELPRLQSRHAAAMRFFQTVADTTDLDACVRVLEPEDVRTAFDLAFRRFSQSMDMLLPDQRALAYHADLRWLGKIRGTARARYRDDRLDLSGCGEKVRKLIADAVVAAGIQILVKEVQLFSPEFEEKVAALATDDAKASEMEHAIRHEINVRVEENPVFYQSLRERLEEIIAERRQERMDAAEQLSLLSSLRDDLKDEQIPLLTSSLVADFAAARQAPSRFTMALEIVSTWAEPFCGTMKATTPATTMATAVRERITPPSRTNAGESHPARSGRTRGDGLDIPLAERVGNAVRVPVGDEWVGVWVLDRPPVLHRPRSRAYLRSAARGRGPRGAPGIRRAGDGADRRAGHRRSARRGDRGRVLAGLLLAAPLATEPSFRRLPSRRQSCRRRRRRVLEIQRRG